MNAVITAIETEVVAAEAVETTELVFLDDADLAQVGGGSIVNFF